MSPCNTSSHKIMLHSFVYFSAGCVCVCVADTPSMYPPPNVPLSHPLTHNTPSHILMFHGCNTSPLTHINVSRLVYFSSRCLRLPDGQERHPNDSGGRASHHGRRAV